MSEGQRLTIDLPGLQSLSVPPFQMERMMIGN